MNENMRIETGAVITKEGELRLRLTVTYNTRDCAIIGKMKKRYPNDLAMNRSWKGHMGDAVDRYVNQSQMFDFIN